MRFFIRFFFRNNGFFFLFSPVEWGKNTFLENIPTALTTRPPPEATLDPDELGCRLTKSDLDALAGDRAIREALRDEQTRAAVERALSAAADADAGANGTTSSSSSAAAALESEGPQLAGLATAVLDCLERAQEKQT